MMIIPLNREFASLALSVSGEIGGEGWMTYAFFKAV